MNKKMLTMVFPVLAVFTMGPIHAGAGTLSVEARFKHLDGVVADQFQRIYSEKAEKIIATTYRDLFAAYQVPSAIDSVSDADLEQLYLAANTAEFYTGAAEFREHMSMDLHEMHKRGIAGPDDYREMYRAFIAAREFAAAKELRSRHEDARLDPVPVYKEAPGIKPGMPTELVIHPDRHEVLRRPVDLDGKKIVIVAHPNCHFSRDAAAAIQSSPALSAKLEEAIWLAPADRNLDPGVFQAWNRANPGQAMTLAYAQDEWPMLDYWGTPTFYFLDEGEVIARVVGWPAEGRVKEINAALEQSGMTDGRSPAR